MLPGGTLIAPLAGRLLLGVAPAPMLNGSGGPPYRLRSDVAGGMPRFTDTVPESWGAVTRCAAVGAAVGWRCKASGVGVVACAATAVGTKLVAVGASGTPAMAK